MSLDNWHCTRVYKYGSDFLYPLLSFLSSSSASFFLSHVLFLEV